MNRLRAQVAQAVDAGIDVVQVRERDLSSRVLIALTNDLLGLARGSTTRIIVNDRLDVAIAAGADGVHLRTDSIPPQAARTIAPARFVIGRSVHAAAETRQVSASVDYLIAGTVWATPSKPAEQPLLGADGLAAVSRAASGVPVLAIGGVNLERVPQVAQAGAAGVAAIGLFIPPEKPSGGSDRGGSRWLHDLVLELRARYAAALPPDRR